MFDYLAELMSSRGLPIDPNQKRSTFLAFFAKEMAQKVLKTEEDKKEVERLNSSLYKYSRKKTEELLAKCSLGTFWDYYLALFREEIVSRSPRPELAALDLEGLFSDCRIGSPASLPKLSRT